MHCRRRIVVDDEDNVDAAAQFARVLNRHKCGGVHARRRHRCRRRLLLATQSKRRHGDQCRRANVDAVFAVG